MGRASDGARPSRRKIEPAEDDEPRAALRKKDRSGRERERLDVSSRGMMYCIVFIYRTAAIFAVPTTLVLVDVMCDATFVAKKIPRGGKIKDSLRKSHLHNSHHRH